MRWKVRGVTRDSGVDKMIYVEAEDRAQAERRANRSGLLVETAEPVVVAPPPPPPVVSYAPAPFAAQPPQPPRPAQVTNGLGVAGLVLGVLALFVAWIPLLGFVAIPVALLGLALAVSGAIVSLVGKRWSITMALIGGGCCVTALLVVVLVTGALISAVSQPPGQAGTGLRPAGPQGLISARMNSPAPAPSTPQFYNVHGSVMVQRTGGKALSLAGETVNVFKAEVLKTARAGANGFQVIPVAARSQCLVKTGRVDGSGNFSIQKLPPGSYVLHCVHLGNTFAIEWFAPFTVSSGDVQVNLSGNNVKAVQGF